MEVIFTQNTGELIHIHPIQVGSHGFDLTLQGLNLPFGAVRGSGCFHGFLRHWQQRIGIEIRLTDFPNFGEHSLCDGLLLDGVAGADTGFGEPLVGAADEEQTLFSGGVLAVQSCQRIAALMAENQTLQ